MLHHRLRHSSETIPQVILCAICKQFQYTVMLKSRNAPSMHLQIVLMGMFWSITKTKSVIHVKFPIFTDTIRHIAKLKLGTWDSSNTALFLKFITRCDLALLEIMKWHWSYWAYYILQINVIYMIYIPHITLILMLTDTRTLEQLPQQNFYRNVGLMD